MTNQQTIWICNVRVAVLEFRAVEIIELDQMKTTSIFNLKETLNKL